tara:strand:+ start:266 stop:520 length:255 start_codon:yes stop_codon:yes gene_type:complete
MNSRGLSPLVATITLIVLAILLGALVMAFSEDFVETIPDESEKPKSSTICIRSSQDPLKNLQVEFLEGKISRGEYLTRERLLLS